jgi:hypothetical protein
MSRFKDQIAKDLDIFINADEFADWHVLNGIEIKCVVDMNQVSKAKFNHGSSFNDGLYECDVVISYKYGDYPKMFATHEECKLDGIIYRIDNFSFNEGLVELRLMKV